mgnify:CR=1 FL=1
MAWYINKGKIMKKQIDITPAIYVIVMIVVFLLGSCKTTVPAAKYQKTTWNGLTVADYESHDGTNYLEDAIQAFPDIK